MVLFSAAVLFAFGSLMHDASECTVKSMSEAKYHVLGSGLVARYHKK